MHARVRNQCKSRTLKDQGPLVVVEHQRLRIHGKSHHDIVGAVLGISEALLSVFRKKGKEMPVFGKVWRWNHSVQSPLAIGAHLGISIRKVHDFDALGRFVRIFQDVDLPVLGV